MLTGPTAQNRESYDGRVVQRITFCLLMRIENHLVCILRSIDVLDLYISYIKLTIIGLYTLTRTFLNCTRARAQRPFLRTYPDVAASQLKRRQVAPTRNLTEGPDI